MLLSPYTPSRRLGVCFLFLSMALAAASSALAGQLSDFERDATGRNSSSEHTSSTSSRRSDATSDFVGDMTGDCLSELCANMLGELFKTMAVGGAISNARVEEYRSAQDTEPSARRSGDALLPFLRLDLLHQNVEGDVTALDSRFEAGSGSLAVEARRTVYREEQPSDNLEIGELHGLYRMSPNSDFEIDAGVGILSVKGNGTTSGLSITIPLRYHPAESFGLEFRPVWSSLKDNAIQDLEAAVLIGWRYASIKAGYRWMHSPHQSLDGPETGISLRW